MTPPSALTADSRTASPGLLTSGGHFLALGVLMGTWATGIPGLKQRYGYTEQELSLVLLALAAGAGVAFLTCARVMRAAGLQLTLRATAVLGAQALLATLLVSSTVALVISAFLLGWGSAAFDVAINARAVALERELGRPVMSKLHAMFSTGGVIAAAAAAALFSGGTPHLLWLAVPAALGLVLCSLPCAPDDAGAPAEGGPTGAAHPERSRLLWRLGAAALLCLLCEGVMYDWSAVYMVHAFAASPALSVASFGVFSAAMAAGRFSGDEWRRRHGVRPVLLVGCLLAAAGALAATQGGHPALALGGFVLVGLGLSNVIPIVFALAPLGCPRSPEHAIAFVSGVGFVGFLAGPPLVGLWSAAFSLDTTLWLVVAAATGVAILSGRRHHP
nr:MFS transporter [uncultured Caldimonas sp.]